uniref:NAD(P)-binding protein n=1 Tax=Panagrellus redivivus TaxID=6233 RepID=A0A7E5A240_PANRE
MADGLPSPEMTKMRISGNILITGANRGIGLALTKALADRPEVDRIYATCRNPETSKELLTIERLCPKIKILKCDVQNDLNLQLTVNQLECDIPNEGLDMLINNAGAFEPIGSSFDTPNRSCYWRHFDVNAVSAVVITKLFTPFLRKCHRDHPIVLNLTALAGSSSITQTSSIRSEDNIVYGMSKAALNHFTAAYASMVQNCGIVTFGISPPWTATRLGGPSATSTPTEAADAILRTVEGLTAADTGCCFDSQGNKLPF